MTPNAGSARVLRVIGAGAARALVQRLQAGFESEGDIRVLTRFGPVGVVDRLICGGEPCDVVITSAPRFADLVAAGLSTPDGSCDLGAVSTALAVRRADAAPDPTDDLRAVLRNADALYCPDLVASTAGAHLQSVLQELGVMADVRPRLHVLPHGALAMTALASSDAAAPIGCAQSTEILATPGVRIVGPLPAPFGLRTVYRIGVTCGATEPDEAARLVAMLSGPDTAFLRGSLGFEPVQRCG